MKEYILIVIGGLNEVPETISLDFKPVSGDWITHLKVTSIIDKVCYNLDENKNYIISNFNVSKR